MRPGRGTSADRLAAIDCTTLSDGRIKVTVYPAATLVQRLRNRSTPQPPGFADMYHADEKYYFDSKAPALNFFCCRSLTA